MKRIVGLILAAMLLATTAYAVPDRMTTYMVQSVVRPDGRGYTLGLGEDNDEVDQVREALYGNMENRAITNPIQWWGRDYNQTSLADNAQNLVTGDVSGMSVTEVVSLHVDGYGAQQAMAYGDETVLFSFANTYPSDTVFLAIVGALNGADQQWAALKAENAGNGIRVTFTADALQMISGKDAVLMLLSRRTAPQTAVTRTTGTSASTGLTGTTGGGTPSKTVSNMTSISIVGGANGKNYDLQLQPVSGRSENVYRNASQFVRSSNAINFFGADARLEAAKLLPSDVDVNKLSMYELNDCAAINYDFAHGEVIAEASYPERFTGSQRMVAMLGTYKSDGSLVWTALKAEPANGNARITFTQNAMTRMENQKNVLVLLAEPVR